MPGVFKISLFTLQKWLLDQRFFIPESGKSYPHLWGEPFLFPGIYGRWNKDWRNKKIFNLVELKNDKIPTYEICIAYRNILRVIL